MALTIGDKGSHDMNFLWKNHSRGPSNSNNLGGCEENMKLQLNQEKERDDETLVNKKRRRDQSNVTSKGKDGKNHGTNQEMHIWTERERRKKMRNMFARLQALLPHLPTKADKSTIVDEAVSYTKKLQQTLAKLEEQKRVQSVSTLGCDSSSMPVTPQVSSNNNFSNAMIGTSNALSFPRLQPVAFDKTWASSNIVFNICGNEVQFSIYASHKPGLMTAIAFVMDKYMIQLRSANVTCTGNGNACIIQFHGNQTSGLFPDANSAEEICKQIARDIMLWIA